MRKNLLKTTLAASALLLSSSMASAADVVTLYERTADTWTDADLTEWVNDNAQYVTQTIDGGLKMASTNSGWNSTKAIDFSENSIIKITATLHGGQASGRSGSYDFITLGDITVGLKGQDQAMFIAVNGTELKSDSKFTRDIDFDISIEFNQATKAVSASVSGGGKNISATGVSTLTTVPQSVIVGHYKAGKENYGVEEILKTIKITQEEQAVVTAEYTINYVVGSETVKSTNGTGVVGDAISLSATETADFFVDGVKYIVVSNDAATKTIAADGSTVVTVTCRAAATYSYTVKSSNPDKVLKEATAYEGETVTVAYPKYILKDDGTLSEIQNNASGDYYATTFTLDQDNKVVTITYSNTNIADVVFYIEAEDIEGVTFNNFQTNRTSNCGGATISKEVTVTTLEPGLYTLTAGTRQNGDSSLNFSVGDEDVTLAIPGTLNVSATTPETFAVNYNTPTALVLQPSFGSSNLALDYLYIQKAGDVTTGVDEVSVDAEAANGKWYNLQGIQVAEPTTSGIYIHNGKKVYLRK